MTVPDRPTTTAAGPHRLFWDEKRETAPRGSTTEVQDKTLLNRIKKAYEEGPLYRDLYSKAGISPSNFRTRNDFQDFPLIDKQLVRDHRTKTGDPFGGVVGSIRRGSIISKSSGTSGLPTFQATSQRDIESIGNDLARVYWGMGARPEGLVLSSPGSGVRPDSPTQLALHKIGASLILADRSNLSVMAAQIEYLKPDAMVAYPNLLERMAVVVEAEGKDLRRILRPVQHIWWGGARLNKELRSLMGEQFDVEIHEHFGIGDMGFHAMDCAGQDGAHFQDDRFFIENLNPDRLEPQDLEIPGELAITALQDESMNYVRWRTEDLGIVKTDPCECGRTSPRVVIFGRVWERTKVDGAVILPHNIESVLLRLFGHESPFQILRSRDGQDPVRLRIAIQSGFDPATVEEAIRSELGITLPVESVTADVILAGSPAYKYRQVVDV